MAADLSMVSLTKDNRMYIEEGTPPAERPRVWSTAHPRESEPAFHLLRLLVLLNSPQVCF